MALFLLCLFPLGALAQSLIKGTVKDVSGDPIIGASVKVQGSKSGVITDFDGNFSVQAENNATLVISYIGYTTETVKVAGKNNLSITLKEDAQTLNDIVVIGYGVQKKSDLTGAVASVKAEDLKHRSTTDAAAALQGKAAGVQILNSSGKPGAGANIRVRGYSSNSSNVGPLLIVDGLQVSSIQYLDPSMIESMEVLKDAASAAIYGAEAGNGVVLITTKSGAKSKGQGTITYEAKFTNQGLGHVGKLLNASQFKDWMTMQLGAAQVESDLKGATEQFGWNPNTNTDWMKEYFEDTWAQQHTLSFQGGNDRGSYFLSTSYVNQDGIVKGSKDKYERLTAQINADYKIKDWLQIGTNTAIEKWASRGVSENGYGSSFEMLLLIDPLTPLYWTSPNQMLGQYRDYYNAIQAGNSNYTLFGDENGYYATSYFNTRLAGANPFSQRDRAEGKNEGVNVNGTVFMNITPIKQVTFTSRLGYRLSFSNSSDWQYPYYLNAQTKGDNYSISGSSSNSTWYQWENFINYNQDFGKHNVGAMAGMSFRQYNSNGVNASASGPDILKSYEPNFRYLNCVNGNDNTTKNFGGVPNMTRAMSYFGRVLYSYDNRYSLQGNFRADAFDSSKLSKDNRWGYFFSGSAGWTFSNEKFFKDNIDPSIMSFGKIRASWGTNGNVNVLGNYSYTAGISTNSQFYNYGPTNAVSYGSMPNGIANPDLTWEKSEQFDLGADFRFFNDRLSLGIDWYKKTTKDLLVSAPVMPESGVSSMTINAGKVENSGLEVELTWKDNIGDFRYSISGNFATLHNEVTYLDPSIERIQGATVEGASPEVVRCYFEQGQPVWYMRGYKYAGRAADGTPQYYAKDGSITNDPQADDMTNVGSGLPSLTYGITLNAEYKGFDLTVFGAGEAGNDIYYGLYRTGYNNIAKGVYDDFKSGKLPEASSVAGSGTFWRSSAMVYSGSFFKLKQIQLGYTLPTNLTKKVYMQNVRAYVSLDDFFTFTKYPGLDPETCTQEYNCPGLDKGNYPNMRKLVLGLSVTF
ncbi:TonB-linked outer membrane protein, SusC/RagA family [Xylanibacter ruminicola]|uniref:TonB-linked outer membrane protein, SusC/RagA family n=1 Tax=Xylanibacter ruminicola TaxID=839 RepID=A0A1H3XI12_XYLRU|nr:TonB-dependent receptor [Xylanibacter ruminicola]SDZ99065.1 TonB-linked outer membrane protein, SusC/RagA family [Xylanibacter ruminicola]